MLTCQAGIALGYQIHFRAAGNPSITGLAHELTHVFQYDRIFLRNGGRYAAYFMALHALPGSPYKLTYPLDPGRAWTSYNLEQQADIVRDCFRSPSISNSCSVSPFNP